MVLTRSAAKAAARAARIGSAQSQSTPATPGGTSHPGGDDSLEPDPATPARSLRFDETELPDSTAKRDSQSESLRKMEPGLKQATNHADDMNDMNQVDDSDEEYEGEEPGDGDETNMVSTAKAMIPDADSIEDADPVAVAVAAASATVTGAINSAEHASDTLLAAFAVKPDPLATASVTHSLSPIHERSELMRPTIRHRSDGGMVTSPKLSTVLPQHPETKADEIIVHSPRSAPFSSTPGTISSSLSKRLAIGRFCALFFFQCPLFLT